MTDILKSFWRERKQRPATVEGTEFAKAPVSGKGDELCVAGGKRGCSKVRLGRQDPFRH